MIYIINLVGMVGMRERWYGSAAYRKRTSGDSNDAPATRGDSTAALVPATEERGGGAAAAAVG